MLPLHLVDWTVQGLAELSHFSLTSRGGHGHVENLRGRVVVGRPCDSFAFVLELFLVIVELLEDEGVVVGVEDLEIGLGIIDLVLSLDGIEQGLELYKCTALLFDEDDLAYLSEVTEDVVDTVVVESLG